MMSMKGWVFGSLVVLLAVGMLLPAGTFQPAWANSELHLGARVLVPGWDVRGNRETYIVLTREDITTGGPFANTRSSVVNSAGTAIGARFDDPFDNCRPRGFDPDFAASNSGVGRTNNVARTDLGPGSGTGIFVDDVHVEYYGKTCIRSSEVVHMSCGDTDLLILNDGATRRQGFSASVAADGVGAADLHYIINGSGPGGRYRKDENSLMATVIIADAGEGWFASYPAASAKSTTCLICDELLSQTEVGYEPYPMEVFLPFAFADGVTAPGGKLSNLLFLFSPNLFPGETLNPPVFDINWRFWDGRERFVELDISSHFLIRTLGAQGQSGQDAAGPILDTFTAANFICGHAPGQANLGGPFENDGAPRPTGTSLACTGVPFADTEHQSDNFDTQTSNPIGWWRFQLARAGELPNFPANLRSLTDNSGRGLVGVVLSTTPGAAFTGIGDATRLWHKDPCEVAQSGDSFGPPHVRDASLFVIDAAVALAQGPNGVGGSVMTIFNALTLDNQAFVCELPEILKSCLRNGGTGCFEGG
ncbi:MAG: hypothetical protein HW395_939, partial [candidate division NC10 bacterium]|nr:hypothetical protein [candidate division NC10 bacterium]